MAKKMPIKVLGYLVVMAIVMMPVLILAENGSNNTTDISNSLNELENRFTENNSAEMMIPLLTE